MNKQRNSVLIIIILILVVVAASRSFFSCRSHFNKCDQTFNEECNPAPAFEVFPQVDEGFQKLDEGIQKLDEGIEKMDESMEQLDESVKQMNEGIGMADSMMKCEDPDFNFRLDTIMYAGYLKKDFPYPIVFHFNDLFELKGFVVRNEVYFPQSMIGRLAVEKLDSTNSLHVTLNTSTSYTFSTSTIFSTKSKILQMVNYRFSYPLKTAQGCTVAVKSGHFKSKKLYISRGLPMGDSKRIAKDKVNRLKIENVLVSRIRDQLSQVSGY